jgi:hypothetical protein
MYVKQRGREGGREGGKGGREGGREGGGVGGMGGGRDRGREGAASSLFVRSHHKSIEPFYCLLSLVPGFQLVSVVVMLWMSKTFWTNNLQVRTKW